jgi:gamma-glutamylcyclotransferase
LSQPARLYFAYGSNMCADQMRLRCPRSHLLGSVVAPGWRFLINRAGFATLQREPAGVVHGVVWSLAATDEAPLDDYEGVAEGHYRQEIVVLDGYGPAMLYRAADERSGAPLADYLDGIVAAARTAAFPADYIAELAGWRDGQG